MIKKYSDQIKRDLNRSSTDLYFLRSANAELYGEYHYVIGDMRDEIDKIINKVRKGTEELLINPQLMLKNQRNGRNN